MAAQPSTDQSLYLASQSDIDSSLAPVQPSESAAGSQPEPESNLCHSDSDSPLSDMDLENIDRLEGTGYESIDDEGSPERLRRNESGFNEDGDEKRSERNDAAESAQRVADKNKKVSMEDTDKIERGTSMQPRTRRSLKGVHIPVSDLSVPDGSQRMPASRKSGLGVSMTTRRAKNRNLNEFSESASKDHSSAQPSSRTPRQNGSSRGRRQGSSALPEAEESVTGSTKSRNTRPVVSRKKTQESLDERGEPTPASTPRKRVRRPSQKKLQTDSGELDEEHVTLASTSKPCRTPVKRKEQAGAEEIANKETPTSSAKRPRGRPRKDSTTSIRTQGDPDTNFTISTREVATPEFNNTGKPIKAVKGKVQHSISPVATRSGEEQVDQTLNSLTPTRKSRARPSVIAAERQKRIASSSKETVLREDRDSAQEGEPQLPTRITRRKPTLRESAAVKQEAQILPSQNSGLENPRRTRLGRKMRPEQNSLSISAIPEDLDGFSEIVDSNDPNTGNVEKESLQAVSDRMPRDSSLPLAAASETRNSDMLLDSPEIMQSAAEVEDHDMDEVQVPLSEEKISRATATETDSVKPDSEAAHKDLDFSHERLDSDLEDIAEMTETPEEAATNEEDAEDSKKGSEQPEDAEPSSRVDVDLIQIAAKNNNKGKQSKEPKVSSTVKTVAKEKKDAATPTTGRRFDPTPYRAQQYDPSKFPVIQERRCFKGNTPKKKFYEDFLDEGKCSACSQRQANTGLCRFQNSRAFPDVSLELPKEEIKQLLMNNWALKGDQPDDFMPVTLTDPESVQIRQWKSSEECTSLLEHYKGLSQHALQFVKPALSDALVKELSHEMLHMNLEEDMDVSETWRKMKRPLIRITPFGESRTTCDFCLTTIFLGSYMCGRCAKEFCLHCWEELEELPIKRGRGCSYWQTHPREAFYFVTRAAPNEIQAYLEKMNTFPLAELKAMKPLPPFKYREDGMIHIPEGDISSVTLPEFQQYWAKGGIPILLTGMSSRFKLPWTPDYMIENWGQEVCYLYDCADLRGKTVEAATVETFFNSFEELDPFGTGPVSLKLKDWPPTANFSDVFPDLFKDFENALPFPEYTTRKGPLNLASWLPKDWLKPDLGPKMYNAYPAPDFIFPERYKGKKAIPISGTTNLHLDITDAVNIMVYTAKNASISKAIDDSGLDDDVGAIWHIFPPSASPILRQYLNRKSKKGKTSQPEDPIHAQCYYLSDKDIANLPQEARPFVAYQRAGDAIFIPAGCAHQVRNVRSSIKVAVDFLSPENVNVCKDFIMEGRVLAGAGKQFAAPGVGSYKKEDVLQLWNCLYFASRGLRGLINQTDEGPILILDDTEDDARKPASTPQLQKKKPIIRLSTKKSATRSSKRARAVETPPNDSVEVKHETPGLASRRARAKRIISEDKDYISDLHLPSKRARANDDDDGDESEYAPGPSAKRSRISNINVNGGALNTNAVSGERARYRANGQATAKSGRQANRSPVPGTPRPVRSSRALVTAMPTPTSTSDQDQLPITPTFKAHWGICADCREKAVAIDIPSIGQVLCVQQCLLSRYNKALQKPGEYASLAFEGEDGVVRRIKWSDVRNALPTDIINKVARELQEATMWVS